MSLVEDFGLVLDSFHYQETDRIVKILTLDHGLITLRALGVNKPQSKNRYSLNTFTFGNYLFFAPRYKVSLGRLKTGYFLQDHFPISKNYTNYQYATALAQLISQGLDSWCPAKNVFRNFQRALKNFKENKNPLQTFVLFLFYHLAVFGGPVNNQTCQRCGSWIPSYYFFDPQSLGWVCQLCQRVKEPVQSSLWLNFLQNLMKNTYLEALELFQSSEYLLVLGRILMDYYWEKLGLTNCALQQIVKKPMFQDLVNQIYTTKVLTETRTI